MLRQPTEKIFIIYLAQPLLIGSCSLPLLTSDVLPQTKRAVLLNRYSDFSQDIFGFATREVYG